MIAFKAVCKGNGELSEGELQEWMRNKQRKINEEDSEPGR